MSTLVVAKTSFKPKAFEFFRRVEEQHDVICITDHGREVARIIPAPGIADETLAALRGQVVTYEDPLAPVAADEWEAGT